MCAILILYSACFTFPTKNTIKYYNLFIAVFCNSDFISILFNISFVLTVLFSMKMVLIGLITYNTIQVLIGITLFQSYCIRVILILDFDFTLNGCNYVQRNYIHSHMIKYHPIYFLHVRTQELCDKVIKIWNDRRGILHMRKGHNTYYNTYI